MNLVEMLLKSDKTTVELERKTFQSKRMQKFLGTKNPVAITIQQIPARRMSDLMQIGTDKKGNRDSSKMYDVYLALCAEGIVDPPMKDEALMKKFGAGTPRDLVEKIFDMEASDVAGEIVEMSSIGNEEDVKN